MKPVVITKNRRQGLLLERIVKFIVSVNGELSGGCVRPSSPISRSYIRPIFLLRWPPIDRQVYYQSPPDRVCKIFIFVDRNIKEWGLCLLNVALGPRYIHEEGVGDRVKGVGDWVEGVGNWVRWQGNLIQVDNIARSRVARTKPLY